MAVSSLLQYWVYLQQTWGFCKTWSTLYDYKTAGTSQNSPKRQRKKHSVKSKYKTRESGGNRAYLIP